MAIGNTRPLLTDTSPWSIKWCTLVPYNANPKSKMCERKPFSAARTIWKNTNACIATTTPLMKQTTKSSALL